AELLGAPVYTEFVPSTASFPASHPLFRGSMVRLAPDVRKVLEQYDVLFSVGGDLFTLSLPSDVDPMPPGIKRIHLAIDPGAHGIRRLFRSGDTQCSFGMRVGGIGWWLPATIGVKLVLLDLPVVALFGDGSAMYTCQVLFTAAR